MLCDFPGHNLDSPSPTRGDYKHALIQILQSQFDQDIYCSVSAISAACLWLLNHLVCFFYYSFQAQSKSKASDGRQHGKEATESVCKLLCASCGVPRRRSSLAHLFRLFTSLSHSSPVSLDPSSFSSSRFPLSFFSSALVSPLFDSFDSSCSALKGSGLKKKKKVLLVNFLGMNERESDFIQQCFLDKHTIVEY